jgi:hypothetical protein
LARHVHRQRLDPGVVQHELAWDSRVDPTAMHVTVANRIVSLTGSARSYAALRMELAYADDAREACPSFDAGTPCRLVLTGTVRDPDDAVSGSGAFHVFEPVFGIGGSSGRWSAVRVE